jgi:4-hydroxybenzoate polyprenyltransferase
LGAGEVFFNDTRTMGISLVYITYVFVTTIFWIKWIHYYGHVVYVVLLIVILAIFWDNHSHIALSRYTNW